MSYALKPDRVSHECRAPDGCVYAAEVLRLSPPGPLGEGSRIRILKKPADGEEWVELPLRLTWWSRLAHAMFASWPPEVIDVMTYEHGRLTVLFRDPWVPYEKPIMPFGLDRESLWEAVYMDRQRAWTLRRVRHLDYESGDDVPPVLEDALCGTEAHGALTGGAESDEEKNEAPHGRERDD